MAKEIKSLMKIDLRKIKIRIRGKLQIVNQAEQDIINDYVDEMNNTNDCDNQLKTRLIILEAFVDNKIKDKKMLSY